jgi:DNA-binding NarL/FixJ family response regulator
LTSKKSILIIDDHPLFREGLKSIIAGDQYFVVEGEAGNARDGYAMARKIKPDVALVDISLPDESGMQLTRRIRESLPDTRVMIVSMHSKIDYIVEAFQAGATG